MLLLIFLVTSLFGAHQPIPDHLPISYPQLSLLLFPTRPKRTAVSAHTEQHLSAVFPVWLLHPHAQGGLLGAEALQPVPSFISLRISFCGNSSSSFPSPVALHVVPLSFHVMLSCKSGQNSGRSEWSSSHICCKHKRVCPLHQLSLIAYMSSLKMVKAFS